MGSVVNKVSGFVGGITGATRAGQAALAGGRVQSEAGQAAAQGVTDQYGRTLEMIRPQVEAGDLARQQQMALLGLSGQEAQQTAYAGLQESPAQQFLRERGQRALLQNQAAIGGLGGGNVRSALQQQGIGFAQQDIENQYNRLAGLSSAGQTATTNLGQFGQNAANSAGNFGIGAAAAEASGIYGQGQAQAQGFNQLLQLGGMAAGALMGGPAGAAAGGSFLSPVGGNMPSLNLF